MENPSTIIGNLLASWGLSRGWTGYLLALLVLLAGFAVSRLVAVVLERSAQKTSKDGTMVAGLLRAAVRPLRWGINGFGILLALQALPTNSLTPELESLLQHVYRAGLTLVLIWFGLRAWDLGMKLWMVRAQASESRIDDQLVPILRSSGRVFLILLGILLVLQNLGISVSGLLAGFGIGSAAIALAAKETLSNVLGSIVIFFDRPFMVGDWIEMGDQEGTVEEIGLRTTRIRTFAHSLITIPNARFTTEPINNWSRMQKRRIRFTLDLTYVTSPAAAKRILDRIRSAIADDEGMNHDFSLVNLSALADSGWQIFVYCFTSSTVWAEFMAARESFLFTIWEIVEEEGGALAYPTTSVLLETATETT